MVPALASTATHRIERDRDSARLEGSRLVAVRSLDPLECSSKYLPTILRIYILEETKDGDSTSLARTAPYGSSHVG
jgi:hypothetical protein